MTTTTTDFRPRQRPPISGRTRPSPAPEFVTAYQQAADVAVAEPFKGVTVDGTIMPGLYPLQRTGVSTRPVLDAARAFLAALDPAQRAGALLPLDTDLWRRWSNIHICVMRHGAGLDGMTAAQREAALDVLRASLSTEGFAVARDVMRLNESIGEITGSFEAYGEWLYWLSVMGEPSSTEPWGWQIDGHHLIVNCLVAGDQLVMTPLFLGSEPVAVGTGKYAGTRVFEAEEQRGLALIRSLSDELRDRAVVSTQLPAEVLTTAFRDNFELRYEGVRYGELSSAQQRLLLNLTELYVRRIRPGHAEIKLDEVKRHLASTYFAWIGGFDDDGVFYYRVHSPVILIEFDHLRGVALESDVPTRDHIHTVVRTPNGNDYGKDLLRQHYERSHRA